MTLVTNDHGHDAQYYEGTPYQTSTDLVLIAKTKRRKKFFNPIIDRGEEISMYLLVCFILIKGSTPEEGRAEGRWKKHFCSYPLQWKLEGADTQNHHAVENQVWYEMASSGNVLQAPPESEGIASRGFKTQNHDRHC